MTPAFVHLEVTDPTLHSFYVEESCSFTPSLDTRFHHTRTISTGNQSLFPIDGEDYRLFFPNSRGGSSSSTTLHVTSLGYHLLSEVCTIGKSDDLFEESIAMRDHVVSGFVRAKRRGINIHMGTSHSLYHSKGCLPIVRTVHLALLCRHSGIQIQPEIQFKGTQQRQGPRRRTNKGGQQALVGPNRQLLATQLIELKSAQLGADYG